MYIDAAYYYRPNSMVCLMVYGSATLVSFAKTAEPIEMPFGLRTRVGPKKPCIRWRSTSLVGKGNFEGIWVAHCKV